MQVAAQPSSAHVWQMEATRRSIVGTSSSIVLFVSFLRWRTQPEHRPGPSQQPVQPSPASVRENGHGLLPQPATQIGSHDVSNWFRGCFFLPGLQMQIGVSLQVEPQCMQAAAAALFGSAFAVGVVVSCAVSVFGFPADGSPAPAAATTPASTMIVMDRIRIMRLPVMPRVKSRSRTACHRRW
ncbi:MAG: hypothetical protein ACKO1M_09330 [Planctomycetota bacterium]